ncbi:HAD-IC family P-type ATPase [Moorella naiadis]|uniref:cation-translocating P-type ATPase n=1 Tax=Moorella naiadis (nom. illeg.) TaxID=3093670 RepID=UPI003D9CBC23
MAPNAFGIYPVHQLPGRVRLHIPGLKGNQTLAASIITHLQQTPGVRLATASTWTGRVLVYHDPSHLSLEELMALLGSISGAPGATREVAATAVLPEWHTLAADDVLRRLASPPEHGLDEPEVRHRQEVFGANILVGPTRLSPWQLFKQQLQDLMVRVLMAASGLSLMLGRVRDAVFALGVVTMNAVLGAWQELKAARSLSSLGQLAPPTALVTRAGREQRLPASALVPGDIIRLQAGDRVPADARLLEAVDLEVEEATLTGESVPVRKQVAPLGEAALPLGDRSNMVFMGTSITRGRGRAVVVGTGMATQMGQVAGLLQAREQQTPLQASLGDLGRVLAYGCLAVSGVVLIGGLLWGRGLMDMVMTAASLAVAAIPEGMPVIVALALAFGVQRMARRRVIVRRLPALETLGCTTVICTDKTGTLTRNEMTVRAVACGRELWQAGGEGYRPEGSFTLRGPGSPAAEGELRHFLTLAALCSDARLASQGRGSRIKWLVEGDPTEGALLVAAMKAGLDLDELPRSYARCQEVPFNSEDRCMTVLNRDRQGRYLLITKGAPEVILERCNRVRWRGKVVPLTPARRRLLEQRSEEMAGQGLRVLAVAYSDEENAGAGSSLICSGLAGMQDPPRPEVRRAIARCHAAGIKVVMITGDHPATAAAIAKELGILTSGGAILTGQELENLADAELDRLVPAVQVFARTSPQHKLRIVQAWQRAGGVVAMTGDGVNDAPAVKAADIGLAMGQNGADVTREAASLVLTDDNFVTIVTAVEEGRTIDTNIRKAIRYLLGTNIGDVVLTATAVLAGLPLPLLPIQLLWLNLVGDSLPALALVKDPPAAGIMEQPPRQAQSNFFAGGFGRQIITRGVLLGLGSLFLFALRLFQTGSAAAARSLALAGLLAGQLIHIFDCRLMDNSGTRQGFFSNPYLLGAGAWTVATMWLTFMNPTARNLLHTMPLSGTDWLLATATAAATGGAAMLTG